MTLRYSDLDVWKKAIALAVEVYTLTAAFPKDERFGMTAQFRRAAISISLNIAEGHGRATRGEFLNQLSVARGSLMEVNTLCELAEQLAFVTPKQLERAKSLASDIEAMLVRLRSSLMRKQAGQRNSASVNADPPTR